ncbi:hypothetical protein ACEWY4_004602 [Coilia grayii]|uniref:TIMELESS-interacting protein n=1 Tax=Coilia grayii TaxID=363190 RepID=A0ABD1KM61_9TELE
MQISEEHYHIAVPPSYEDLQDEKYQPFPPPLSPVFAQLPRKRASSSGGSTQDVGDEKIDEVLLSHMQEEPMTAWRKPQAELDVDMLVSEKGIFTLGNILCNTYFKGEGYEMEDLHTLLGEVESWACQLYPQHTFDDLVSQFENIGDHSAIKVPSNRIISLHAHTGNTFRISPSSPQRARRERERERKTEKEKERERERQREL